MAEEKKFELPADVAKKYKMGSGLQATKTILPLKFGRQEVDFSAISVEEADALVAKWNKPNAPFPYLVPVNTPAIKPA